MKKLKLKANSSKLTAQKGQIMLEALVALSVILIGILGIFSLTSRSLSLNTVAGSQYVASNLAAEGIEIVKNIIDGNIMQGRAFNILLPGDYQVDFDSKELSPYSSGAMLNFNPETGLYGYSGGDPTTYKRKINVTYVPQDGADEMKVTSTVNWTTRDNAEFEVTVEDYFYNWR